MTAGGELGHLAQTHGWPLATVPIEAPARHSLGWLLVPLLASFGLDDQIDDAVAVLRCDLISVYTALARGVDPTPVAAIDDVWAVLA